MIRNILSLILSLIPVAAFSQQLGFAADDIPATHEYVYKDTVTFSSDGHRMVTQLYLPKGEGPWPVVVYRTPYFNFPPGDFFANYRKYAERGMGFLIQRCRGTGGSEGIYEPNIYERGDGLALLQWLQDAPWCSSIALTGCSYMGLTSWIVADVLPEKVKGIYLEHYGVDRHLSAYSSGAFRQDILTAWAIDNAKEPITVPEPESPDTRHYNEMRYMPQITMDVDRLGAELPWYRDWISHPDYTDSYWHEGFWGLLKSIPPKIDVPVTVVAGHFDHHMEGTLLGYELLSEPLDEPLMISGPLTAKVWFSSDCEDTAVTVKVSEERADGTTYNIRTGIATLAYRDDKLGSRQTYIPGEIVEVTVEMLPIVWELQPGSRIRVDISSSDFPQYSIHSNYPGVWSHQTKTRVANQKVHIGKKHPTRVILPIL